MKPTVISADALFEDHRAILRWQWLAGLEASERRFDEVAMMVVKENRALLRHHINCFGEMEPLS